MRHRVFVAINFPSHIKDELEKLKKHWPILPCRWVPKQNLHLTLAFLGYLNEEGLEKVMNSLAIVGQRHHPFSFFLDYISYGPDKKFPPRLLWLKGKSNEALLELKKNIDEVLNESIGYIPETRDFIPHITLARIKKWQWRQIDPEDRPQINKRVNFKIPVNSFEIMESHLKRSGAQYEILKSISLKEK